MKQILCVVTMLAICLTLISPALAAEDTFVPSIS